jgi:hypothetical protein
VNFAFTILSLGSVDIVKCGVDLGRLIQVRNKINGCMSTTIGLLDTSAPNLSASAEMVDGGLGRTQPSLSARNLVHLSTCSHYEFSGIEEMKRV